MMMTVARARNDHARRRSVQITRRLNPRLHQALVRFHDPASGVVDRHVLPLGADLPGAAEP
jgi:hypothetical protein